MNLSLTREQVEALKQLDLEQLETFEEVAFNTYNAIGQARVTKMLQITQDIMDELYFAEENNWFHNSVKTCVFDTYDGIGIYIAEYPPKLKQFVNVIGSKAMGMRDVSRRWGAYMLVAINQLRNKGIKKITTPAVAIYRFRTPYKSDPDNFAVKILNDNLRDARFITDDSCDFLSTYITGVYDKNNPGTEIFLLPKHQFCRFMENILTDSSVAII